ncbi:MAG: DNA/RNA non-specific endonuclease [Clostridia bacterium]|nr:DNA/RNA non-specific endonuclease [Clostridia bacterium]
MKKKILSLLALLLIVAMSFTSCSLFSDETDATGGPSTIVINGETVPSYTNKAYVYLNNGEPTFTDKEITTKSYEFYSELDSLGRCGVTHACIGVDLMPTDDRGEIGSVTPSGWKYNGKSNNNKYDTTLVEGGYIYNRCHLIGFQLAGENANEKNLVTGTRYLNIEGMLPFENMIADYVKETKNHVMFRVTPIYDGNNLVPSGIHMEGYSVEDEGEGISFNVYAYNVQPGIEINYATGENWLSGEAPDVEQTTTQDPNNITYILNKNSMKFHKDGSSCGNSVKEENKDTYTGNRQDLIDMGYSPCGTCKP